MRNAKEIQLLLEELDRRSAGDLEDQDLDFKEWNWRSTADSVALVVEMAVCMANGGGGTVVFGINDKKVGRLQAVIGIPPEIDVNRLKKAVYDTTDPKLTPVFEELHVPEGTGRLLIMQIYPGLPPYTDTAGRGKIRIGKDCQPLTGTLRRRILVETGETDFSKGTVPGDPMSHLSAAALEQLRDMARRERAPEDLLHLGDLDLLTALGVIHEGRLTRAGILLAGRAASIQDHLPGYVWTHLRMQSETQYTDRMDGRDALPVALARVTDRIMADNPITTVEERLFHFEYRTYPEVALREALMNAFCHANYQMAGPILVKQFPHKIEISNPGGLVGGISPDNILHHQPIARNPLLVETLTRLRLINRSNLGIPRMFTAFLIEGKVPPVIEDQGTGVKVTFFKNELSVPFRVFIAEEDKRGHQLTLDHLLVLQHLLRFPVLDRGTAAFICQRPEREMQEILFEMEERFRYLERDGVEPETSWTLRRDLHSRLSTPERPEQPQRINWEEAKGKVLNVLKQRAEREESGLTNAEIRRMTHMSRGQIKRLLAEIRSEGRADLSGKGRGAVWVYRNG